MRRDLEPIRAAPPHRVGRPLMRQVWSDLTFLHWRYPPAAIAPLLPPGLELDLCDGAAWVGLVPFAIEGLAFRIGASQWGNAAFPETNVRTYVIGPGGARGVWFFSLDAGSLAAVLGARAAYALPYYWARMRMERGGDRIRYTSRRRPGSAHSDISIHVFPEAIRQSELDQFLTARFRLYSSRRGKLYSAEIEHEPWPLRAAGVEHLEESLFAASGLAAGEGPPLVYYSERVEVLIGAVRRVRSGGMSPDRGYGASPLD